MPGPQLRHLAGLIEAQRLLELDPAGNFKAEAEFGRRRARGSSVAGGPVGIWRPGHRRDRRDRAWWQLFEAARSANCAEVALFAICRENLTGRIGRQSAKNPWKQPQLALLWGPILNLASRAGSDAILQVRRAGFEPARSNDHPVDSRACLPKFHHRRVIGGGRRCSCQGAPTVSVCVVVLVRRLGSYGAGPVISVLVSLMRAPQRGRRVRLSRGCFCSCRGGLMNVTIRTDCESSLRLRGGGIGPLWALPPQNAGISPNANPVL